MPASPTTLARAVALVVALAPLATAACGPPAPPQDPIARAPLRREAATREEADHPGSGVLEGTATCGGRAAGGDERWFRLEPGPFTAGEIRVFARLEQDGPPARLEADVIAEGDRLLATGTLSIRAVEPRFDVLVVPVRLERPRDGARQRTWVRVRSAAGSAPARFAAWFRRPAQVGP
jgi:hypothetical protein